MNLSTASRTGACVAAVLILYWIGLCVGTHLPPHTPILHWIDGLWDKALHFSGYGGLAFLLALTWALARQRRHSGPKVGGASFAQRCGRFFAQRTPCLNYLLIWTVVVAYGSVDEPTQPLFQRDCDIFDLLADALGAATALALFALLMALGRRYWGDPRANEQAF
ncbi:MAG TPA: VanZ family protein [Pirellulales bacterium]|jgi:VanZ family protein|nr:VanZ family protein [Pirellulales bacterium]